MYKITPYLLLFVVVSLLQVLFFDNLEVSILFSPLIYVVFILLLPLQTSHFVLLLAGLCTGVVMDFAMGVAAVNTIATLFIAFMRPYMLMLTVNNELLSGSGVPSDSRFGVSSFIYYLVLMVILHHAIFFALESLSLRNWELYAMRMVVSSATSIFFVWLIARAFAALVLRRR